MNSGESRNAANFLLGNAAIAQAAVKKICCK
jgi:hypothetical protein